MLRTSCSHAPPTFRSFVALTPHFALHVGRVIKSLAHFRASTKWSRTFDPDIILIEQLPGKFSVSDAEQNRKHTKADN